MSDDLFAHDDNVAPFRQTAASNADEPRQLTGRMVLAMMLAFFAVIVGVNTFMVHEALSTFGGVDTESSYRAGQLFEHEMDMAKAQDARHWRVEAKVTPAADGSALLDIVAHDASGAPLAGVTATAAFERPTDRRLDRTLAVSEHSTGHFQGTADIVAGQWDLIIELSRGGERVFRSKNRIVLH